MPGDRRARVIAAVEAKSRGEWSPARLCEVTPEIVGVTGAGAMLMSGDLSQGSLLHVQQCDQPDRRAPVHAR